MSQMQNYMQTIANENVQALANYANKSDADTNAIETLKELIIEIKAAQTAANKKNQPHRHSQRYETILFQQ